MKTKEILYDEITTEYNGEFFNHGKIEYKDIQREDKSELTRVEVDFRMAIMKDNYSNFAKELNELVQKYAM